MEIPERAATAMLFVDLISAPSWIDNAPAQAQNHFGKQRGCYPPSRFAVEAAGGDYRAKGGAIQAALLIVFALTAIAQLKLSIDK